MIRARLAVPVVTLFLCVAIASTGSAQDAAPPKAEGTPQSQTLPHAYRLEYTLTELKDGKRIDSRQYSINVGGGTPRPWRGIVRIGTKVPAGLKSDGTNQYLDVDTRIDAVMSIRDGAQVLETNVDVSSMAPDEAKVDGRPIFRTLLISNQIPVTLGRAVMVGTADDPDSKRTFQLEVTVTEIK